ERCGLVDSVGDDLASRIAANQAEAEIVADRVDESTSLSWLWAFLCGPLYFAFWGFWGRAVVVFVLNFALVGFLLAPFLAYPAWRGRALEKAEKLLLLESARRA
ncbi:MAG: hypothetical protein AAF192_05540, partial [Pseudomonadota bacterium]